VAELFDPKTYKLLSAHENKARARGSAPHSSEAAKPLAPRALRLCTVR
jgi:hypothetical protein